MKHDINIKMFVLVLFVLIVLAGLTAYYHSTLSGLAGEYQKTSTVLEDVTGKLSVEEAERLRLDKEEDVLRESKRALEAKYSTLKDANERLEEDHQALMVEFGNIKKELLRSEEQRTTAEANYGIIEERFTQVQAALEERNDEVSIVYAALDRVCSKLKGNGLSDDSC